MAVNIPGLSTLGIKFAYGVETEAGAKPSKFDWLERCSEIAGISLETETIDVSTLEDLQSKYVAGRQDTGGTWEVTFNLTTETIKQLKKMMDDAAKGLKDNYNTWFEVWVPSMEDAFFIVAQPGSQIPLPDFAQNEALTGAITLAITEYKGLMEAVEPTEMSVLP